MAAVIAYLTAAHSKFGRYAVIPVVTAVVYSKFRNFGHSQRGGRGLSGNQPPPELERGPCIKMAHAPASAPTQKLHHIDGKFHWLRQQVVLCDRTIGLACVPTADQAADYLTKACPS